MSNQLRPFAVELFHEILSSIYVVKPDLSLYYEMLQQAPSGYSMGSRLKGYVQQFMRRLHTVRVELDNRSLRESLSVLDPFWDGLQDLYARVEDSKSRQTLVKIMAHRILGAMHVTLPADTLRLRELYRHAQTLEDRSDSIDAGFRGWQLHRMKLESYGSPVTLYANAMLVLATFGMKQYEYRNDLGVFIGAKPGDVVIDAGGCWADTALYFADRIGNEGRVLTFEFDPKNLGIFQQNMSLNPSLAKRVTVIPHPLWDEAGVSLAMNSNGPASRANSGAVSEDTPKVAVTATIDQVVQEKNLGPIGFIKMDIEGAELAALRGAVETLRRDRPRLAISVYHSLDDYVQIPRWIAELNLGYRFYLGHETIFDAETILFAEVVERH